MVVDVPDLKEEKCQNCKFCKGASEKQPSGQIDNYIACFRFPPQMSVVPMKNGYFIRASHAKVNADSWCGEWKPRISIIN